MRLSDLTGKNIVIWGLGREGLAAAQMIRARLPDQKLLFIDESLSAVLPEAFADCLLITENKQIEAALTQADCVVKSPGVSLYHPLLEAAKKRGLIVTSLLNLWRSENPDLPTVAITGTKGKSTTASLLLHVLQGLGCHASLVGNIGTPVTTCTAETCTRAVIEVSSYQAANFSESCSVGVLLSLYPEHLNWHGSLQAYYHDKANLLYHSEIKLCAAQAMQTLKAARLDTTDFDVFNECARFHFVGTQVHNGSHILGELQNAYLCRVHNQVNVCAVLAVCAALDLDLPQALAVMKTYRGLAHRQQELGEKAGLVYVDDSISTTPQSALAAMEVYQGRAITLIVGGQDRGIDYQPLLSFIEMNTSLRVICIGEVGQRLYPDLSGKVGGRARLVQTMAQAVALAQSVTPVGGVVLLSPAAPSYDMFKDFTERAAVFAREAGFDDPIAR